jgi:hypothetical protein
MNSLDWGIILGLYFAPTIVAGIRRHHNMGPLVVVNVLLGWTLIGWVVALAMAFSKPPAPVLAARAGYYAPGELPPKYDVMTGERLDAEKPATKGLAAGS